MSKEVPRKSPFAEDVKSHIFAALHQWHQDLSAMDRREPMPAWNANVTTAEAGILHLLGVRYEYEAVNSMAHLGMKEENIPSWLCDPNPKEQIFNPYVPKTNATTKNPYASLSRDIVEQAIKNLLVKNLIQTMPVSNEKTVRLMINRDTGLALTPFSGQAQGTAQESPSDRRLRTSAEAVHKILNRPVRVPRIGLRKPDSDKREK